MLTGKRAGSTLLVGADVAAPLGPAVPLAGLAVFVVLLAAGLAAARLGPGSRRLWQNQGAGQR